MAECINPLRPAQDAPVAEIIAHFTKVKEYAVCIGADPDLAYANEWVFYGMDQRAQDYSGDPTAGSALGQCGDKPVKPEGYDLWKSGQPAVAGSPQHVSTPPRGTGRPEGGGTSDTSGAMGADTSGAATEGSQV